jgi:hypothetical protein
MAFSITVTSPMSKAERISRSLGVYAGKVSITSYSQTLVECTAITRYFIPTASVAFQKGIVSCQIDGPSSGGFAVAWDATTGAFKCYSPTGGGVLVTSAIGGASLNYTSGSANLVTATSAVGTLIGTAASQADANSLIGTFGFIAIGFIHA